MSNNYYKVSGNITCSYLDMDIDQMIKISGNLYLNEKGIKIICSNGSEEIIPVLPFKKWEFERDDTLNNHQIRFKFNGIPYSSNNDIGILFFTNLTAIQIEELKNCCLEINNNNEISYKKKISEENSIIEQLKKSHNDELSNFIYNNTNGFLSVFTLVTLAYDHLMQMGFFRKIEDCFDWSPEDMGPIMLDYEFQEIDYNFADEFLANLNMLVNYLEPVIQKLNIENADISLIYITYKALFDTAVVLYHDYYLEDLGNPYRDNIDDLAVDLAEKDNLTYSDVMIATYFLYKENISQKHYAKIYVELENKIDKYKLNKKQNKFNNSLKNKKYTKKTNIDDIDLMTGSEFETFIADLFSKKGYTTTVTKASGDQGIDVIAERNDTKIGIQVKCYSGTVGNSAIQEAVAGKSFYSCDKAMVITNSSFTSSAIDLAQANDVILWDREILKDNI